MTTQIPEDREHVVDSLPAYLNGQLDADSARRVREHLVSCESCRLELASWEAIKGATNQIFTLTPLPSTHLMQQVWEKIDAPGEARMSQRWFSAHILHRFWLVFRSQIPLIHRSLWIGTPLLLLLWCLFSFYDGRLTPDHAPDYVYAASLSLALLTTISAAAGTAFIYGGENDPGLELTLSTPTSLRGVMFARFVLVVGYNVLFAACASAALALLHGGSFWDIMQLWLGPMVLLSSFTLTLSMLIGSWFALAAALVVELSQSFVVNVQQHWPEISLSLSNNWHTTPAVLCLAALLIAFAVFSMSRQPRLSQF